MPGDGLTWQERRRRRKLLEGIDATWYRDCPIHGKHMPVDPYDDTKLICCSPPTDNNLLDGIEVSEQMMIDRSWFDDEED